MPTYGGKCNACNANFSYMCSISKRNEPVVCPHCGMEGERDVEYELNTCGNFDETCKEHERWSWSMGVNPEQIPEAVKNFPGSEYHPVTGQLKIKSRKHKQMEMKRRGYEEYN